MIGNQDAKANSFEVTDKASRQLYVAMSEMGTVLRKFAPDGKMLWELYGLCFVDLACADPATDEREVWDIQEHYVMDYGKPLHDRSLAVVLFNRGVVAAPTAGDFADLGPRANARRRARDLWQHNDRGVVRGALTMTVPAHGVVMLRLFPARPAP